MGKNNKHKKFLKSEKAKVKLKGGKKLLLKGQNITDTSFKVKKIVIQSQLAQQPESEPVTRKNLNLKVRYPRVTLVSVTLFNPFRRTWRAVAATTIPTCESKPWMVWPNWRRRTAKPLFRICAPLSGSAPACASIRSRQLEKRRLNC